jgi:hypothetical protein
MVAVVLYRFRPSLEYRTLRLESDCRVFDIKAGIIEDRRMQKGLDNWDLEITNDQTGTTYSSEIAIVPDNSQISVRKIAVARTATGILARLKANSPLKPLVLHIPEEEERALLNAFEVMEGSTIQRTVTHQKNNNDFRSAVCKRCGEMGHIVRQCQAESIAVKKSLTGLPKSCLQALPSEKSGAGDGKIRVHLSGGQIANIKPTTRINPYNNNVFSLEKIRTSHLVPDMLKCILCSKLIQDGVWVKPCDRIACDQCVQTHLSNTNYTCPFNNQCRGSLHKYHGVWQDDIYPITYIRQAVQDFIRSAVADTQTGKAITTCTK